MGAGATKIRTTQTAVSSGASTRDAVLAALAVDDSTSLAQLRLRLEVGAGGPTEGQMTRALRQLVEQGRVTRPKRGYYRAVHPEGNQQIKPSKTALVPTQRTPDRSEALARPLRAAPARPKRVRVVETAAVEEAVETAAVKEVMESARAEEVVESARAEEVVEAAPPSPEVDRVEPEVAVATEPPASAPAGDDARVSPAVLVEVPAARLPKRADMVSPVEVAESAERTWLRRAALPVLWFALTGLALMFSGVVVGALIAVILGFLAVGIYRRERHQQMELEGARARWSEPQISSERSESLDTLGVH